MPHPVSILVVDDKPRNVFALLAALASVECNLVTAESGRDALKCVLTQDFAVILLDVHMPGMDGFEAASLIHARERSHSTPIIFLTADDREGARAMEGYRLGAVDYIHTPVDPDILRAKVTFFVELFKRTTALEQRTAELTQMTSDLLRREHEIGALNAELEERVTKRTSALEIAISDLEVEAAALQESEIRYRSLVESSPNAILVHVRGLVVFANAAAMQLLGAAGPEQLIGTPVLERVHADSRASVLQRVRDLQVVGAEVPAAEERVVRFDGTPIEVEIAASAVLYQGHPAIQVVVRDITERKLAEEALRASEERFRKQYKGFPLPTFSWLQEGDDFVLQDFNDAAKAVDEGDISEWVGARASERYRDDPELVAYLHQCVAEQHTLRREMRHRFRRTGLERAVAVTYVFVPPQTAMVHVEDITEAKQAEQQGKALAQSEKLRALGQMATGIAHDLNQSLMLVASYSDLASHALVQDPLDLAEIQDLLTTTTQAALDGGETVKRLLQFTRAAPEHDIRPVDLAKIVRDAAQLTAPRWRDAAQAEGRPITLVVEADGHPTIQGSAAQLRELMTNVIFNAVDALPDGGTIHLRVVVEDGQGIVEVVDSGVGMSAEVQERVFEPFFTTKGEAGTGLGLAMVFGIVEQHDGHIQVRSAPGAGTTFRITLPLVEASVGDPPATHAPVLQSEAPRVLRVLVVDDEPMMTKAVMRMLKPSGHAVSVAGSGEEALEMLAEQVFDVVVSDMGMGAGMNGWELVDAVKRRWPAVRFLLATGWGAAIDPGEARGRGVEAVLAKPYHPVDLLHALSRNETAA
jgi:PAS domain S-box-containing protein